MKHLMIIVGLSLMSTFSFADSEKAERKKARHEHRQNKERFDNRSLKQKIKDTKVLSCIAIVAIIVFRKVDDSQ